MDNELRNEVEWAMEKGIDPDEHVRSLTHPPIKEGSSICNDLLAIQEARNNIIELQLKSIKESYFMAPTYRSYRVTRREFPNIEPYQLEAIFGRRTAEWELRYALECYAEGVAETGTVLHHLGRDCDQ